MAKSTVLIPILAVSMLLSTATFAEGPQVYKWIDTQGVLHYSDKPPVTAAVNPILLKLPRLPPVDPAKIAATDAWIASVKAMQQHLQAEQELVQQQRELAEQQAQLQAAEQQYEAALAQPAVVYAGYPQPRFVPHHDRSRNEFQRVRPAKPVNPATKDWPFPYNLTNNSSFPEEWHRP